MQWLSTTAKHALRLFWRGLREWSGDDAYERYLLASRRQRTETTALTRKQFYVEQLRRRYSRPNRCC